MNLKIAFDCSCCFVFLRQETIDLVEAGNLWSYWILDFLNLIVFSLHYQIWNLEANENFDFKSLWC